MTSLILSLSLVAGSQPSPCPDPAPIEEVETAVEKQESQFFHYRKGEGAEKTNFDSHSLLTLNLCMMNGSVPAIYGGMTAPIAARAQKAAIFVAKENPDIFLAQEVTLQSSQALYEEMKSQYPHFWVGIGIEPGKKEADLFVASKYPIVGKPVFIPFPDAMQNEYEYPDNLNKLYGKRLIERGFFALETSKYWIATTHLEPGNMEKGFPFRRAQLAYLTEKMDEISRDKPYILAGDLNIARTDDDANEYPTSGISDLYYDFYTEHHPEFNESTFTCTNLFTSRVKDKPDPVKESDRNEIDDYVLIRKFHKAPSFKNLQVELLKGTYDVNQAPSEAFTDHRAYKATFQID